MDPSDEEDSDEQVNPFANNFNPFSNPIKSICLISFLIPLIRKIIRGILLQTLAISLVIL